MTGRERVQRALRFERPDRVPRDLWALPWAWTHYPQRLRELCERFPADMGAAASVYRPSPRVSGDPYMQGMYVDDWGCVFENMHPGVIGEVKAPQLTELSAWRDVVRPPVETLPEDWGKARDKVNRSVAESPLFIRAGCNPRPWERFQFLRGTVDAMCDVMAPDEADLRGLLRRIHEHHLRELEFWTSTDVDAISFMDDWGSQTQLLIPPAHWRELFKPLYRDYCELAHSRGKFAFMHSDGCIAEIYPDLIEVGVDALNSQLFCMDLNALARYKGRITFWGEIDRQHVLVSKDTEIGRAAVRTVASKLGDPRGGLIAQFELGPGCNPETGFAIFEEWERVYRTRQDSDPLVRM